MSFSVRSLISVGTAVFGGLQQSDLSTEFQYIHFDAAHRLWYQFYEIHYYSLHLVFFVKK